MKKDNFKLSVIIPCYNERDSIKKIIDCVKKSKINLMEIIVVDDFSTDGTRDILENEIKHHVDKILYHEKNMGKGAALRTGIKEATGDAIIIQDADLEYDPSEYPKIIEPIVLGQADVVYGSRFIKGSVFKGYFQNVIANRLLTMLSNFYTGLKITDMETCYKCFKRDLIQSIDIEEDRFGFEPEITAKMARKKAKIVEVPISYNPRTIAEGKKIGFKDGLRALYCIRKYKGKK